MGDISSMQFSIDVLNGCSRGCSQWMYSMGIPVDVPIVTFPMGVPVDVPNVMFPMGVPMARFPERRGMGSPKSACVAKIFDFAHAACEAQIGPNLPLSSLSLSLSFSFSLARAQRVCSTLQKACCNLCFAICAYRYYHHSHGRLWRRHCRLLRASTSTTSGSTRISWSFRKNDSRNSWLRRRRRKTVWSSCLWITTTAHIE